MLQQEIECKARITQQDVLRLQTILEHSSSKSESIYKQDTYYIFSDGICIRLRCINEHNYVLSFKEKHIEDALEQNIEHETEIADPKVIDSIFSQLKPQKCIKKIKSGMSYVVERDEKLILVELIEIQGLGYFIELEHSMVIEVSSSYQQKEYAYHDRNKDIVGTTATDIRATLYNLLDELHISRDCLEPRYYIDLLQEG